MPKFSFFRRAGSFTSGVVVGAGLTAAVGVAVASTNVKETLYPKLEIFAKVVAHIENNYVEDVDESKLIYGAIRGMVTSLDPHSTFLDPADYKALVEDANGEFGGLGFEFQQKDDGLVVLSAIDDSPASRAGLRAGDVILAIDNAITRGMTLGEAATKLKGPAGSTVKLLLTRHEFSKAREFVLVRDRVRIVSVEGRLIGGQVGYVKIKSFQDRTDAELKKKLSQLRAEAGPRFKGLILDLRNNPGGLLDQGVKVADRFLSKGVIVTTKGRGGRHPESEVATDKDNEPNYPLVILINRGSASASEVVAGALQDQKRAVLLGSTSFGKGSVQTVIDLDDGSALKLTIARYYTPSGRSIQGRGISPDVLIAPDPNESKGRGEEWLPRMLTNDAPGASPTAPSIEAARVIPATPLPEEIKDDALASGVRALLGWEQFQASLETERARAGRSR